MRESLSVHIPFPRLVCMMEGIWNVFPSRIRLETAGVARRISRAATRPPALLLQQRLRHDASSDSESMTRICA
jgi:hypothetical protein